MAENLFVVIRRYGPPFDPGKPLEAQVDWEAHRVFMNALEARGLARLAGPLQGGDEVLLIFRAVSREAIERELAADPWTVGNTFNHADCALGSSPRPRRLV